MAQHVSDRYRSLSALDRDVAKRFVLAWLALAITAAVVVAVAVLSWLATQVPQAVERLTSVQVQVNSAVVDAVADFDARSQAYCRLLSPAYAAYVGAGEHSCRQMMLTLSEDQQHTMDNKDSVSDPRMARSFTQAVLSPWLVTVHGRTATWHGGNGLIFHLQRAGTGWVITGGSQWSPRSLLPTP